MIVEDIHNQVHRDKELDIVCARHGVHFALSKRRQLAIYSAGCKRNVCSGFNSGFLHS